MGEMMSFLAIRAIGIYGWLGSLQRRSQRCLLVAVCLCGLCCLNCEYCAVLRPSSITPLGTSERLLVTLTDSVYTTRAVCLAVGSRTSSRILVRYCWRVTVKIDC